MGRIKAGELDRCTALEEFVSVQAGRGLAPKTVRYYLYAVKGYVRHEGVSLDNKQVSLKVGILPDIESRLDRIPTRVDLVQFDATLRVA